MWPRSGELRRLPGAWPQGWLALEGLKATWHSTGAQPHTERLARGKENPSLAHVWGRPSWQSRDLGQGDRSGAGSPQQALACCPSLPRDCHPPPPLPPPACPTCPQVLENYNKGKTALLSAAKVMVSPTEVDLTPELIFQQQPLPTGPPVPAGLALELPAADHRNNSVR